MQTKVSEFIKMHNLKCSADIRLMDLVSEVGELSKEIIKGTNYEKSDFLVTENTALEVGDCLFSLLALCDELGINSKTALNSAIEKYNTRFSKNGNISSND